MCGSPEDALDITEGGELLPAFANIAHFESDRDESRLDVFLSRQMGITRSFAQKLIKEGYVAVQKKGGKVKPSRAVHAGEGLSVTLPPTETLEIEPEEVPFEVVYEDRYLLVVNKPAGLVVHPAPGHWKGTLVHGILWRYPDIGPFNNVRRPGIVHRLDATTSGLMLVAREPKTMELLQEDFRKRTIEKKYLALVRGNFVRAEGILEGPIGRHPQNRLKMAVVEGGRPSTTEYRVLWNGAGCAAGCALVVCGLLTGRTHQIRVHMAAAGHPLFGDTLYGGKEMPGLERVFLHSWRLTFTHPITEKPLSFTCPLSPELREYLKLYCAQNTSSSKRDQS